MSQVSRTVLKTYFNTGDTPNEAQFENFIESVPNITDDEAIMHVAKAEVLFSNVAQTTIVTLPADAVVWAISYEVITGFNDSGTNVIDFGVTGDSTKIFTMDDGDIDSPTFSIVSTPYKTTGETITFQYVGQNSDATTGAAYVYIHYTEH